MGPILVRVLNKITGEEMDTTYHAYKDTEQHYTLIGQVDSKGNLIDGNPNLEARHKGRVDVAVPVVESGLSQMSLEEKMEMKAKLAERFARPEIVEVPEPKKRGPKPKVVADEA